MGREIFKKPTDEDRALYESWLKNSGKEDPVKQPETQSDADRDPYGPKNDREKARARYLIANGYKLAGVYESLKDFTREKGMELIAFNGKIFVYKKKDEDGSGDIDHSKHDYK